MFILSIQEAKGKLANLKKRLQLKQNISSISIHSFKNNLLFIVDVLRSSKAESKMNKILQN
jgi:hypothetical protein